MLSLIFTGIGVVGGGIQAGALLMVLLGVCPTFRQLPVPEWMRLHVSLDRSIERYMPALNIATSLATLALLFLPQPTFVRLLRVVALAHNIALAAMSELVNVRLNKQIAREAPVLVGVGGAGALTEEDSERLVAVRERWIGWHAWRTAVIVTGFVEYVVAALFS